MSARNKARGYEHEREIVLWAQANGIECRRIFGSGAFKHQLGDEFAGDIVLAGLRVEAKRRKTGFKVIYDAFDQDDSDVVCVRADRKERLWIVKDDLLLRLLK
tara:strand:- start:3394 stop:3702 length:309 start_codon:yes stop_codon:yes gene_type:complete